MERVNSTTGVLQPGTINFPTAWQTPLLSDKLVARMDDRDQSKKKKKRGKKGRGRVVGQELTGSLRNPGCRTEDGWMRGEAEEGWTEGGFRKRKQSNYS